MTKIYRVVLAPPSQRELDKVPANEFSKIDKAIRSLSRNPRPIGIKKLDGHIHRIRVGHWRIIYAILDEEAKIVILRVGRRNEKTYRGLS